MNLSKMIARDGDDPTASILWDAESPIAGKFETRSGDVVVQHGHFRGGTSDGVEVVTIDTGVAVAWILPTRGMSIWKIEAGGIRFGWDSPVAGPVHPSYVPIDDASGIGWLEGFDELLVRCGLESNGAPQFSSDGNVEYPLHGRIANLAATSLSLEVNVASGRVELSSTVVESRLFVKRLRLDARIRMTAGQSTVDILDDVTNDKSTAATMQMLYHINVGAPVLGEDAALHTSAVSLKPRDADAAVAIDNWSRCEPPTSGFAEQVYFVEPKGGEDDWSIAMLTSSAAESGFAVHYCTTGLPWMSLWKNTAALEDGYVVGIEPATGLPLTRRQEEAAGRLVRLDPNETVSFRMKLVPLVDAESVAEFATKVDSIQGDTEIQIRDLDSH